MEENAINTFITVKNNLKRDADMRRSVVRIIGTQVLDIEVDSSGNDPRFKYLFNLQEPCIISLYDTLKLEEPESNNLFPSIADSFTNILMLLTAVGIKMRDNLLVHHAFFLVLAKTWNLAVGEHFPEGIDDSLFEIAIDTSHDEMLKKYQTPFNLLTAYMLPNLLEQCIQTEAIIPMEAVDKLHVEAYRQIDNLFRRKYIVLDSETKQRRSINGIGPFYREVDAQLKDTAAIMGRIENKRRESAG
ncbi:MAG: hypothetical protein ACOYOS_12270 [Syntrophales bacterium]